MSFFKASSKKDLAELFLAGVALGSGVTLGSIIVKEVIYRRNSRVPLPREVIDDVLAVFEPKDGKIEVLTDDSRSLMRQND